MLKFHDLKTAVIENESALVNVSFFYLREKNDINGNPRYRVYIMDPETPTVYETICKCYESQIADRVAMLVKETEVNKDVYFLIWNGEEIDETESHQDAIFLKREYNLAFHGGVTIKKRRVKK